MNRTQVSIALVLFAGVVCSPAQEERKQEEHKQEGRKREDRPANQPARHETQQQAPQQNPANQPSPRQSSDGGGRRNPNPDTTREAPRQYPANQPAPRQSSDGGRQYPNRDTPREAPPQNPANQPTPRQPSDGVRQYPNRDTTRDNPGRGNPNANPGNAPNDRRSVDTYTPPPRTSYPSDRGRSSGNVAPQRSNDVTPRYPGGQVSRSPNGAVVERGSGGQVREIRTQNGAVITRGPAGLRTVAVAQPGNRVVVATANGRAGYVQRPLVYGDRQFTQRTYYGHGASYVRVYRPAYYGGAVYNVYTPVRYYRPGFYAWAWNPWPRPVAYSWGWGRDPWYGYYGGYFAPYPVYPGPLFWLTDYLIGTTLREAYYNRIDAGLGPAGPPSLDYAPPPGGGEVALTPDVKQAIADEVRRQLDMERAEAQNAGAPSSLDAPPAFADGASHVFVAHSSLLVNSGGYECTVSEGDVLQLTRPPAPNALAADLVVLASKGQDCRKGAALSVRLEDLQEMQNHMRETVDQGLADLQSRQGSNGVPPLPAGDRAAIVAPYATQAQPDDNAATQIRQVAGEADRAEQDATGQAPAGPIRIALGMTVDEVENLQGPPQKVVDLGSKKIYVYNDIKITFTDGRVSDVQ